MSRPRATPTDSRAAASALVLIPARLGSTRLAQKLLLRAAGRPLIEHTARNAMRAERVQRLVVATDAEAIETALTAAGIEALRTGSHHQSGTDRIHEAHALLRARGEGPWDVVVNVQGDEPELPPAHLDRLIAAFDDSALEAATLSAPIDDAAEANDPAVVKVVCDAHGDALYFSRAPIPARAHSEATPRASWLRHVGVYAFRPEALASFCALPQGRLERAESLEQLRWLEAGRRMRCLEVERVAPGIDTREHFDAFRARVEVQSQALPGRSGNP